MVLKRNIRDRLRDVIWTVLSINYVRFGIIYIFYISCWACIRHMKDRLIEISSLWILTIVDNEGFFHILLGG